MIRYECDKCGEALQANDPRRFIVKFEVYAAAGHIELESASAEATEQELTEVLRALSCADPDDVEDQTYRALRFDVCDVCRRKLLKKPLG